MSERELCELTVSELLAGYARSEFSPVEVIDACLAQIARVDESVQAVITLCADIARKSGKASEARWAAGTARPLEGVPYGLKDIVATAGIRTTGGSNLYLSHVPSRSAPVAERLDAAGGALIAKLNTFEFAFGELGAFEPARNPWNVLRTPGGSSSGSAAALAAREMPLAVGTDTGGSIRVPAGFCGVTGFKPTYGKIPREGVMPLAWSLDHVGPMARSVVDVALAFDVMAGVVTAGQTSAELTATEDRLEGLRIGVPDDWLLDVCDAEVRAAFTTALEVFANGGADIKHVRMPHAHLSDQRGIGWAIVYPEMAAAHADNLDRLDEYGPVVRQRLVNAQFVPASEYIQALRVRRLIQDDFEAAFQAVDVVMTPTTVALPPRLDDLTAAVDGVSYPWLDVIARTSMIFNLAGIPALSVPAGLSGDGLPIGLQIAARSHADHRCLALGAWYQERTPHHRLRPDMRPLEVGDSERCGTEGNRDEAARLGGRGAARGA